jgi:hypothetical protein
MIVYEKNTIPVHGHSYIERFWGGFSLATPYMRAKVWYVLRPAETYTRIPDMYPAGMLIVEL